MTRISQASFAQRNRIRLASIFIAFSILVSVFYIPCYYYVRQINAENVVESHQRKLDIGMRTFNMSLRALANLDSQIMLTEDYRMFQYAHADLTLLNLSSLSKMLNTHLLPYDFIAEAGLSMDGETLLLRNLISHERDELNWRQYIRCSSDAFLQPLSASRALLPAATYNTLAYGSYEAITAVFKWSSAKNVNLFVTYPVDKLCSYLADEAALVDGCISLYLGDELLAQKGNSPTGSYQTISTSIDNVFKIRAEVQLTKAYIDQGLEGMYSLVKIFITAMILAILLWIVLFTKATSKPLNRINEALSKSAHVHGAVNTAAEMARSIHHMDSQLTDYQALLKEQKERILLQTLEKAIYRGIFSAESLEEFHEIFPTFPKVWHMVLVQYVLDESSTNRKAAQMVFVDEVRKAFPYHRVLALQCDALLIIAAPEEPVTEILDKLLLNLEDAGFSATYTISAEYNDPAMLSEAFHRLEYSSIILQQQPSASPKKATPISMQQLSTLYMALQCGDGETAIATYRNGIGEDTGDFFTAQYNHRMISNILLRIKLEVPCDLDNVPIPAYTHDHRELFEKAFPECMRRMTDRMNQQRQDQSEQLEEEIVQFIRENITNKQLCRTLVTDQFRISAPTLQKRLQASVGKSFSTFVEDLRMAQAQQLLRESSLSTPEIADAIGYANANSFYKAYKRRFGEPPRTGRR